MVTELLKLFEFKLSVCCYEIGVTTYRKGLTMLYE